MDIQVLAAVLVDRIGEIRGKKAFQKLVYLAKVYGISVDYHYEMHYYGPYSAPLADDLDERILREQIFELKSHSSYIFVPSERTGEILSNASDQMKDTEGIIESMLSRFGNKSPNDLELYATIHFICQTLEKLYSKTDRKTRIEEIKKAKYPKFSEEKIVKHYDEMVEFGLVSVTA